MEDGSSDLFSKYNYFINIARGFHDSDPFSQFSRQLGRRTLHLIKSIGVQSSKTFIRGYSSRKFIAVTSEFMPFELGESSYAFTLRLAASRQKTILPHCSDVFAFIQRGSFDMLRFHLSDEDYAMATTPNQFAITRAQEIARFTNILDFVDYKQNGIGEEVEVIKNFNKSVGRSWLGSAD